MADVGIGVVNRRGGRVLIGVGLWLIMLALGANIVARFFPVRPEAQGQMPGMGAAGNPTPPVTGFAKGQEIRFIHTEASDPQVAAMLTRMMGPKVLVVPSLKEIPDRLLASVFVFRNGIKGEGPMGFQPDVFDTVPGNARYTPLRRVVLVGWKEERRARILRSAEEIRQAAQQGDVNLTTPGIVVNMPMLTWPGGHR
ncbi:MAG: DUF7482 domain-containing protein [Armatimonadota bacterium]